MDYPLAFALLVFVLVTTGAMAFRRAGSKGRLQWWQTLAESNRLRLDLGKYPHDAVLSGIFRGVRVEVRVGGGRVSPSLRLFTRIVAQLPGSAPPGFLLTSHRSMLKRLHAAPAPELEVEDPALAGPFQVHGNDPVKTAEVLADRTVRHSLLALREECALVHVDERAAQAEVLGIAGPRLPDLLDHVAQVAAGISEAYERAWADFAKEHGLVFLGAGTRGERTLRGYLAGTRVTITTGPMPDAPGMSFSTIKVSAGVRLPAALRVLPRALTPEARGEVHLGFPALDEQVRVQGTNREAVRALLTHPPLRDHLVAFYEACPFTMIEGGQVTAGGPGLLGGDIIEQVKAVNDLAATLRSSWETVRSGLEGARQAAGK